MKRFIAKICYFLITPIVLAPIIIVAVARICTTSIDWKLPPNKHILFMGASHIQCGINDSLTMSAINLASSSERYMFTYNKMVRILEHNNQVDTIFLECASTDLFEHADDKYFKDNEMVAFYAKHYPLFNIKQWGIYLNKPITAYSLLFRSNIIDFLKGVDYKYFCDMFLYRTPSLNVDSVYYKPVGGNYGNSINYEYLRKIIELCNSKSIKLYFLYCPVYKPEFYYDQNYYYNAYKKHFSDVELLDYSHFNVDIDDRYDAHHLNARGAVVFTNELKQRFNL